MGEAGVVDLHAGGCQAHRELAAQGFGDLFHIGAQRDGAGGIGLVLQVVVGVHARHVAQRRLGLHGDIALVVVDVEERLGGIGDVPHHDGCDLDGVAHFVVDLQALAIQGAHAGGDSGGVALGGLLRRGASGFGIAHLELDHLADPGRSAHALAKERVGPEEALVADGAHVLAEQDAHARLAGLQREESVEWDEPQAKREDAEAEPHP